MSKYDSINEFSKILGVSAQTLRNWDNNDKLHPHHTSRIQILFTGTVKSSYEHKT